MEVAGINEGGYQSRLQDITGYSRGIFFVCLKKYEYASVSHCYSDMPLYLCELQL